VLVQGRFPLYTHALRSLFDVGVWLEREADLALKFTVHREIGGAAGEHRRADYATYLAPQAKHAEVCVRFTRPGVTIAERGRPELNVDVADEARVRALEAELGSGSRPARLGAYAGAGGEGTSAALGLAQLVVARHVEWAAARRAEAGAE
jgi:hypothetical protein